MKSLLNLAMFSLLPLVTIAQNDEVSWDKSFRENGMIYVVLAVVLLILLGMFGYLISQDMRMRKIENELKEDK